MIDTPAYPLQPSFVSGGICSSCEHDYLLFNTVQKPNAAKNYKGPASCATDDYQSRLRVQEAKAFQGAAVYLGRENRVGTPKNRLRQKLQGMLM